MPLVPFISQDPGFRLIDPLEGKRWALPALSGTLAVGVQRDQNHAGVSHSLSPSSVWGPPCCSHAFSLEEQDMCLASLEEGALQVEAEDIARHPP